MIEGKGRGLRENGEWVLMDKGGFKGWEVRGMGG